MARNRTRAARRNAERRRRNAAAIAAAVELAETKPKRRYARSKTVLELPYLLALPRSQIA